MAHPGGRPTKYNPLFVDKVEEYLQFASRDNMHLPKIVSFARFIEVAKSTLYEWAGAKDKNGKLLHPEFSDALAKIMEAQEERLQDDGIYGGKEVNATIVKLLLQNNHGMKERTDTTTNDKDIPSPIYNGKSGE